MGSLFIIDPLYTLPLLLGVLLALAGRNGGLRANVWGLVLSTAYIGWSVLAQHQVVAIAQAALKSQGIAVERVLVVPSAFNTVLWRVVAVGGGAYHEGHYSFLDDGPQIDFRRMDRGDALLAEVQHVDGIQHIRASAKVFTRCRTIRAACASPSCAWASTPPSPSLSTPRSGKAVRPPWPWCRPLRQASGPT